ncbi:ABC transporter permease [Nonomuraea sp. NPDC050328]|uniref:ABC transporter permease n=1 Tax=Nonomuraea sp. NPDC050328 TaxID=3364361 RepID=UPI00378A07B1
MIWLTWRQFRGSAALMGAVLTAVGLMLVLTGPGLADEYAAGIADCAVNGRCDRFYSAFFGRHDLAFLSVTLVVLLLPALVGLFWGAPLITRELESGTHLLVWNQSVTRTRWLAVKLALIGLVVMAATCLLGLAVTWWSGPLDRSADDGWALMSPLVFDARGIVPMAYAAFGFVLGIVVGLLARRTLAAMALTLLIFTGVQLAVPLLVRPHLQPPIRASVELTAANVDGFSREADGLGLHLRNQVPTDTGAWVLSSRLADPAGRVMAEDETISLSGDLALACTPSGPPPEAGRADPMAACFAELNRLGYRQAVTYHPTSAFWPFQWIETGIYALFTAGLAWLSFWLIRRRAS